VHRLTFFPHRHKLFIEGCYNNDTINPPKKEASMSKSMDKGVSKNNKKKMTAAEKWEKIKAKKAAKAGGGAPMM
jgi:hypothetical protein